METKHQKPQTVWATISTKEGRNRYGDFYRKGEIVEVSIWKRILQQTKRKHEKIVKLMEYKIPNYLEQALTHTKTDKK